MVIANVCLGAVCCLGQHCFQLSHTACQGLNTILLPSLFQVHLMLRELNVEGILLIPLKSIFLQFQYQIPLVFTDSCYLLQFEK